MKANVDRDLDLKIGVDGESGNITFRTGPSALVGTIYRG